MKKLVLAALSLALFSCRGGENTQGAEPQKENENTGIFLDLEPAYANSHGYSSATIYPDSIIVVVDSVAHTFFIDKEKSFESIESPDYLWNFVVCGKDESCPPYDTITVERRMTDIFGEKSKWDKDRCLFSGKGDVSAATIKNEPDIPRQMFAAYPQSKPFPELLMENAKFYNIYRKDSSEIPSFLWPVNRVVIKDNKITFSGGENDVVLEMVPLSDYEQVYSEGYNWVFTTKATDKYPALKVTLNAGFDFEKKELKPKERWISLFLDDIGEIQFDFQSWDNLKRRICVSYPTEEEFQSTMEEGIYPDYSDEE